MITLEPLGDQAFLARFDNEASAAAWVAAVRTLSSPGITDVVLAYRSAAVYADPSRIDLGVLENSLRELQWRETGLCSGRSIEIPVLYDGEDLLEVAAWLGREVAEIIALHTTPEYRVFAIGFQPGFPYAGYLTADLAGLPRRGSPRASVPAGSVAIAGRQTAIYPHESPGGWLLLGRTPLRIVDVDRGRFPISAGDRLRFRAIDAAMFRERLGEPL